MTTSADHSLLSTRTERRVLLAALLVGAALRLWAIFAYQSPLISDDKDYDAIARAVVHGDGYSFEGKPTAYRLPGYPLLLAGSYALFGERYGPVKALQLLFDELSCLLLFAIGKRLFSPKVGLVAAWVLALFPIQILYVTHLMTETIFAAMLLLIVWLAVRDPRGEGGLSTDIAIGVSVGVAVLFRSPVGLFPLVIFLYRWKLGVRSDRLVRSAGVIFLAMFVVLSPWLVRNYEVFHRWTVTSNGGVNFWIGNHEHASGSYSFPSVDNPLAVVDDDFERSDLGVKLAFAFILAHPGEEGAIVAKKFAHFFAADYWLMMTMEFRPEWAHPAHAVTVFRQLSLLHAVVLHLPYIAVLLLGTFAVVCCPGTDRNTFFLFGGTFLYWLFIHLIYFADARYRFPIVPLLILSAAYGWFMVRERTFVASRPRILIFSLLVLLFVAGWVGEIVILARG